MSDRVTTTEAARRAGVTVRQLTHWADRGYLRPERSNGIGRGGVALFWDERDVSDAGVLGAASAVLGAQNLLTLMATALATSHHGEDRCGVLVHSGEYRVTVEVEHI